MRGIEARIKDGDGSVRCTYQRKSVVTILRMIGGARGDVTRTILRGFRHSFIHHFLFFSNVLGGILVCTARRAST